MHIHPKFIELQNQHNQLINRKNKVNSSFYDGVMTRYDYPVLTSDHVPLEWRYDKYAETNPFCIERLGVNAVFNSGAIKFNNHYYLMARIEGRDRKSFFGIARSESPTEGFEFVGEPILLEDIDIEETNVYDIRLTLHDDGYIYGIFCSEAKDPQARIGDTSSAIAKAGIIRSKDMVHFERLPHLITPSPQQRNVTLHPEFVNGEYLLYTRPQDGFIETGSGGGIAYGFVQSFDSPVIPNEYILDEKKYHTIYEMKNGAGPSPIKTAKGWIHIAHGVRNTAAGLRYVLYAFATDLTDPTKVIAKPSGYLLAPINDERIGDVSNVVFSNGLIVDNHEEVYIYYGSSDTRLHVAKTTIERLVDYVFNNPQEVFRSIDSVKQRIALIKQNKNPR